MKSNLKAKKSKYSVGALVLLVSGLICKVLGALFRLPLTNLLGIEGIGIYQLVISLFSFALVFSSGGVTTALSKLIASARAKGEHEKVNVYLHRAMCLSVVTATGIGFLFAIFSRIICSVQGIDTTNIYFLFLLLLPIGAALTGFRGLFQGFENMLPTAISQVIEQIFKFCFGLLFASYFSRISVSYGVLGALLGIVLSELVAVIFLFILFMFKKDVNPNQKLSAKKQQLLQQQKMQTLKFAKREFDHANFPLMLSASILPLVNAFEAIFIIPRLTLAGFSNSLATKLYGLQTGVVGALLNFPLVISVAVTTSLLPNISYTLSRGNDGRVVIERGLKILLFLLLPTTFGLVAISKVVLMVFYHEITSQLLNTAFWLMLYGAFSILFTALMQYFCMLLQATEHFRYILLITALGGVLKAALSFFLASLPSINIFSLVIGNIALSAFVTVLALWKLKHVMHFSVSFFDLACIIFATTAMFFATYFFVSTSHFSQIVNIILAITLGGSLYLVFTLPFIFRLLRKPDKKQTKDKQSIKNKQIMINDPPIADGTTVMDNTTVMGNTPLMNSATVMNSPTVMDEVPIVDNQATKNN